MEGAHTGPGQPRDVVGVQPAPGHDHPCLPRVSLRAGQHVVQPVAQVTGRAGGEHLIQPVEPLQLRPTQSRIQAGIDSAVERPRPVAVLDQLLHHVGIDLAHAVEEAEHHTVRPGVDVARHQATQPDRLAAVGAVARTQPHHHPQLDRSGCSHLLDHRRLRGQPAVLEGAAQLHPVGTAGFRSFGIGGMHRDHFEQPAHSPIMDVPDPADRQTRGPAFSPVTPPVTSSPRPANTPRSRLRRVACRARL